MIEYVLQNLDWVGFVFIFFSLFFNKKDPLKGMSSSSAGYFFISIWGFHLEHYGIMSFGILFTTITLITQFISKKAILKVLKRYQENIKK